MNNLKKFKINLADIRQKWSNARLTKSATFWIVIVAVLLAVFLGFSRGGWVTGALSSQLAETASEDAVVERLALICVAQVNQDPLKEQKLAELAELNTTTRRANYIEEQGWAVMPGETTPDNKVVSECARQLMLLDD